VAKRPLAVAAAPGPELRSAPEPAQVPQRVLADQDHVSAAPTVSSVRAAARDMRLAAKAQAAVATGTRLEMDTRAIVH
jgi:hypothetical protein